MKLALTTALAALALASCRQSEESATDNGANAAESARVDEDAATNRTDNGGSPPTPIDQQANRTDRQGNEIDESEDHGSEPGPPPPPPGTIFIPTAFQGRWGLTTADCAAPRWRENMAMNVTSERLEFYESNGRLQRTIGSTPERFIGIFAYVGEGESWRRREQLALTNSSNTLIRTSDGQRFRYRRCARP